MSIVIATCNRVRLLEECLASIEKIRYPRDLVEVIVVNDGSTDNTANFLRQFCDKSELRLICLSQANQGPAAARNSGVRRASGSLIAFTDDDCTVDVNWLYALNHSIADASVGGVGGIISTRSKGIVSDYMSSHNIVASDIQGTRVPPFIVTANACYRKEVLTAVGGFDDHITHPGGEDPDLSWRVSASGYALKLAPTAIVNHHHKTNLLAFCRSFYHYGKGFRYLEAKHGLTAERKTFIREVKHSLNPRYLAYRARTYASGPGKGWGEAITFTILDSAREIAWMRGYYSSSGPDDAR
jgi:O-antigen biosynthesis protein